MSATIENSKQIGYVVMNDLDEFLVDYKMPTPHGQMRVWSKVPDQAKRFETVSKAVYACRRIDDGKYMLQVYLLYENETHYLVLAA